MIDYLKKLMSQSPDGALTYEEYMNTVLYDETYGYYMKETQKIGKAGDFITSSNISNVFGMLFSKVFHKLCQKEDLPLILCEIGGGNGRFAKAILDEWEKLDPTSFKKLTYIMIEKSPYHVQLQKEILPLGTKVKQFETIEDVMGQYPEFQGIIFSNELFDAFPVRVIEMKAGALREVKVTLNEDDKLMEKFFDLEEEKILMYLKEQGLQLKEGQRFEIPLGMIEYIEKIASLINRGLLFTIDYGYTNKEWMLPPHQKGSLRGFYRHTLVKDPLQNPGEMDLTTHISFDALEYYGRKNGLELVTKLRQDHFLLEAGILDYLQEHQDPNPFSEKSKQNRAIRSLIMSGGMSSAFHVMVQQKGINIAKIEK